MDIFERIASYRAENDRLAWSGTFKEYIELLRKDPSPAMTAHARVYEMINPWRGGIGDVNGISFLNRKYSDWIVRWRKLVEEYFHSAARRLDVRKRILLLMGPVSGGKSTIVTMLKRGLEQFSRTDTGAVYAIKGCPMHEDPLHLIPQELRPEIEKELVSGLKAICAHPARCD